MHAIKEGIFWFLGVELEVKDEVEVMVELEVEVEVEEGSIQKHECTAGPTTQVQLQDHLLCPTPRATYNGTHQKCSFVLCELPEGMLQELRA